MLSTYLVLPAVFGLAAAAQVLAVQIHDDRLDIDKGNTSTAVRPILHSVLAGNMMQLLTCSSSGFLPRDLASSMPFSTAMTWVDPGQQQHISSCAFGCRHVGLDSSQVSQGRKT